MPAKPGSTAYRLRKHADYQRVYKTGRKKHGRAMGYFYATQPQCAEGKFATVIEGARVGLTVPKALGNAVKRNRIKRRMRAAVRTSVALLTGPVDVVLHPRRQARECPYKELEQEVASIFRSVQSSLTREQARPPTSTPARHEQAEQPAR